MEALRGGSTRRRLSEAFVHPDLGIGGAEMLVVNAAMALVRRAHNVRIFTAHHDDGHCFHETLQDGKAPLSGKVSVHGDWLPRTMLGGRCIALCAIVRMIWVSLIVLASSAAHALTCGHIGNAYDVIFCDQVSFVVPLLRLSGARVLFYCHFPDKLLCTEEARASSLLKRIYRYPLDAAEEMTTGWADLVVLNSKFTVSIFKRAFSRICKREAFASSLRVLYPAIDLEQFDRKLSKRERDDALRTLPAFSSSSIVLLSINRFERKKNLALAIEAMGELVSRLPSALADNVHLVMAGGYDERVEENVEHFKELRAAVGDLLEGRVHFVRSFTNDQRLVLMEFCRCSIYAR